MERKQSGRWCGGWLLKRLTRQPGRTLLAALVAAGLLVGVGYLGASITSGYARIDALYDTVEITGEVVSRDYSYSESGAFLRVDTMTPIEELGFFSKTRKLIGGEVTLVNEGNAPAVGAVPGKKLDLPQQPQAQEPVYGYGVYRAPQDEAALAALLGEGNEITDWYAPYTVESFFRADARQILMERTLMDALELQVGNYVTLVWQEGTMPFQIVGSFDGSDCGLIVSAPTLLSCFDELHMKAYYSAYAFTIDRAKNRDLPAFRTEAEAKLDAAKALLVMDDSELTQAVEPLERNVSLLEVLYPAMCVLAALLAAGLAALLVMQSAKEAAILRVLGVRRSRTAALVTLEQAIPAALGVLVGALALALLSPAGLCWRDVWLCAAGYVLGAALGAGASAALRTRKNPLELLQVKE